MAYDSFRSDALRLLGALCNAHGAPGSEAGVRAVCRAHLSDGLRSDRAGNLIWVLEGGARRPRVMLTAHLDEVGFVVQYIGPTGLIRFLPLGGWWAHTLPAQRVRIRTAHGDEVLGVIAAKPPHFLSPAERDKLVDIERMAIDIGAVSAEEVRDRFGIRIGDPIVPDSAFTPLANPDLLLAKAFDNRVGVALLLGVLQQVRRHPEDYPNTILGVGTVQEELGSRGAEAAVQALGPDLAIVLEGTPADDHPDIPVEERQGVLNGGVQIRILDPSAILHRPLVDWAVRLADRDGIKYQLAVRRSGGTDARALQRHGGGIPTLVLGVPARYIHTHNSMVHMHDVTAAFDLVTALLRTLDQEAVAALTAWNEDACGNLRTG